MVIDSSKISSAPEDSTTRTQSLPKQAAFKAMRALRPVPETPNSEDRNGAVAKEMFLAYSLP